MKRWDRTKMEGRALLLRTDGVVPCLLGKPDLHYNQLLRVHGQWSGIRPLTIVELGRLMGVPEGYRMPPSVSRAARLAGEGVAVPAVRWLAANLLEPLIGAEQALTAASCSPRQRRRPERVRNAIPAAPQPGAGVKRTTNGTTAYFRPEELARVHQRAADLGISLHELLMRALDRMLMECGEPPVRRTSATKRAGRARRIGEGDITRLPSRRGRGHVVSCFRPRTSGQHSGLRNLGRAQPQATSTRTIHAAYGRSDALPFVRARRAQPSRRCRC